LVWILSTQQIKTLSLFQLLLILLDLHKANIIQQKINLNLLYLNFSASFFIKFIKKESNRFFYKKRLCSAPPGHRLDVRFAVSRRFDFDPSIRAAEQRSSREVLRLDKVLAVRCPGRHGQMDVLCLCNRNADVNLKNASAWTPSTWTLCSARTPPGLLRLFLTKKDVRVAVSSAQRCSAGSQRVHSTMSKRRRECKEHPGEKGRVDEI
jgi:hypothetical protein